MKYKNKNIIEILTSEQMYRADLLAVAVLVRLLLLHVPAGVVGLVLFDVPALILVPALLAVIRGPAALVGLEDRETLPAVFRFLAGIGRLDPIADGLLLGVRATGLVPVAGLLDRGIAARLQARAGHARFVRT